MCITSEVWEQRKAQSKLLTQSCTICSGIGPCQNQLCYYKITHSCHFPLLSLGPVTKVCYFTRHRCYVGSLLFQPDALWAYPKNFSTNWDQNLVELASQYEKIDKTFHYCSSGDRASTSYSDTYEKIQKKLVNVMPSREKVEPGRN